MQYETKLKFTYVGKLNSNSFQVCKSSCLKFIIMLLIKVALCYNRNKAKKWNWGDKGLLQDLALFQDWVSPAVLDSSSRLGE
jgi:hypothetical protein